jgi:hypothetical protein
MDVNELQGEYVKQISSYDPTGIIPDNLIQVGSEILDEFYDKHSGDTFNIYDKEFGFSFVLGNYLINGYIDRIDFYDEDTINIIDYKTRKMGSYSKGSSKQSSAWHIRLSSINSFSG